MGIHGRDQQPRSLRRFTSVSYVAPRVNPRVQVKATRAAVLSDASGPSAAPPRARAARCRSSPAATFPPGSRSNTSASGSSNESARDRYGCSSTVPWLTTHTESTSSTTHIRKMRLPRLSGTARRASTTAHRGSWSDTSLSGRLPSETCRASAAGRDMRQDRGGHSPVVVDHRALGESRLGPQDAIEIGEFDALIVQQAGNVWIGWSELLGRARQRFPVRTPAPNRAGCRKRCPSTWSYATSTTSSGRTGSNRGSCRASIGRRSHEPLHRAALGQKTVLPRMAGK